MWGRGIGHVYRSEDNLWKLSQGSGDQAQAIRFGSECLNSLAHLSSLRNVPLS